MKNKIHINYDRQNYRSIVLAGLGSVGQGVLKLAEEELNGFDKIVLMDCDPACCQKTQQHYDWPVLQGDIEDTSFITQCLSTLASPILFVNLCSDIDTVKLRTILQSLPVGYLDICESRVDDNSQSRFSVSMPYTNQSCHGAYPHLICQGINPGMAEYMARMMIDQMNSEDSSYVVTIYENDQLAPVHPNDALLVSWSPQDLIDEVMVSPTLQYSDRYCIEDQLGGSRQVQTQWQGRLYPARLVGHEDVWNLGQLPQISHARFLYTLSDPVMKVLESDVQRARRLLRLPDDKESIQGTERVIVSVVHPSTDQRCDRLWQSDHALIHKTYGINAVQFQTAASTLLSVLLMQHTDSGCRPGTFNASTLPLDQSGWDVFTQLMDRLNIRWQPVPKDYVSSPVDNLSVAAEQSKS